ncbi:hypothetical protein V1525DRAFT_441294, partial [Lipomyces kononenkoae]
TLPSRVGPLGAKVYGGRSGQRSPPTLRQAPSSDLGTLDHRSPVACPPVQAFPGCRQVGGVGGSSGPSSQVAGVLGGMARVGASHLCAGHNELPDMRSERWLAVDTVPPLDWFAINDSAGHLHLPPTEPRFHSQGRQQSLQGRPLSGALWTVRVPGLSEVDWGAFWSRLSKAYRRAPMAANSLHLFMLGYLHQTVQALAHSWAPEQAWLRGPHAPCVLCSDAGQNIPDHLFFRCSVALQIWELVAEHLHISNLLPLAAETLALGRPPVSFEQVLLYVHLVWVSYRRRVRSDGPPPTMSLVQWRGLIGRSLMYQQYEEPWE